MAAISSYLPRLKLITRSASCWVRPLIAMNRLKAVANMKMTMMPAVRRRVCAIASWNAGHLRRPVTAAIASAPNTPSPPASLVVTKPE